MATISTRSRSCNSVERLLGQMAAALAAVLALR
jgi:hypothetical protein